MVRVVYAMHDQEIDFRQVRTVFVYAAAEPRVPGVQAEAFLSGESMPVCGGALSSHFAAGPADARAILDAGLLHDSDHAGWRDWLSRASMAPPPALDGPVVEDLNLLRAAALRGQGVALCPTAMIPSDLGDGHLVRLSDVSVLDDHHYYLLTRSAFEAVAELRDWAVASCWSAPR
jgi:DNA-binding transcriptional LysR family regulator